MIGYSKHFNTIVIGVGGMGSATIYQLAKRGQRVLGIERFDIPHDLGSSHGYTRIIRLAYYEHPSYVMLLRRAYELWHDLENVSGQHLLHQVGSIDAGPADSWVFKGSLRSVVEYDIPHEVLTGTELNQRFPGYQLPHDILALYQQQGGFLRPEHCIISYATAAHALGAEIHGRETVVGWEPMRGRSGEGVRVFTDRATYEADNLVITAGAWDSDLLPSLRDLAVPERQVLGWFQPERPELFQPEVFPVFNLLVEEGRYYGFPIHAIPGFKIGLYHHFEEQGHPSQLNREPTWADEEALREVTARYFPQAAGPTMTLKSCMFTNSPDRHFIIDLHPDYPQISFAAGFSGHGYKFASVVGEIMADLAERQDCRHDISLFQAGRFTGQYSSLYREKYSGRPHTLRRSERQPVISGNLDLLPSRRPQFAGQSPYRRSFDSVARFVPRRHDQRLAVPSPAISASSQPRFQYAHSMSPAGDWLDTADIRYWRRDDRDPFW